MQKQLKYFLYFYEHLECEKKWIGYGMQLLGLKFIKPCSHA